MQDRSLLMNTISVKVPLKESVLIFVSVKTFSIIKAIVIILIVETFSVYIFLIITTFLPNFYSFFIWRINLT